MWLLPPKQKRTTNLSSKDKMNYVVLTTYITQWKLAHRSVCIRAYVEIPYVNRAAAVC